MKSMQSVNELLAKELAKPMQSSQKHSQNAAPVEYLMLVLRSLANMKLIQKDAEIIKTWRAMLSDLTELELQVGLRKAADFPKGDYFSLPAFRELCKMSPSDFGLPEPYKAYAEACNMPLPWERQSWSHSAVYAAARETGRFELTNLTESKIFPLFRNNYEQMVKRVLAGEDLDIPVVRQLPEKIPQYLSKDQNRARLGALKELIA